MTGFRRYAKAQRLGSSAIAQVLASGRVRRGRVVALQMRFNDVGFARLGLIVPKRVLERAVDRNRVRRVLREWFRRNQKRLGGQDLLIRAAACRADLGLIIAELEHLVPVQ